MAAAQDDDDGGGLISGINVTPLVDITLVLLIIMMVTAKIIVSTSLPLDLPQAAKGEDVQMVFSIELHANGSLIVDRKTLRDDSEIIGMAKAALEKDKNLRAVIRADRSVQHGRIITVLDLLKQANVQKIAFGVTPIAPVVDTTPAPAPNEAAPAPAAPAPAPSP
jgi:biopolymer transport protein ExbD